MKGERGRPGHSRQTVARGCGWGRERPATLPATYVSLSGGGIVFSRGGGAANKDAGEERGRKVIVETLDQAIGLAVDEHQHAALIEPAHFIDCHQAASLGVVPGFAGGA